MILIDTNILVFAHNKKSPHYLKANQLLKDAVMLKFNGCVTHQNLLEFFSVITNPKRVEKPLEITKSISLVETYLNSTKITKIYPTKNTLSRTIQLSKKLELSKAEIFDCYIASTMLENNVLDIYTEDVTHFEKYPGIKVTSPF